MPPGQKTSDGEGFVGTREAARFLGLSEGTVRKWAHAGRLPAYKFGTRWKFRPRELEQHVLQWHGVVTSRRTNMTAGPGIESPPAREPDGGPIHNENDPLLFIRHHPWIWLVTNYLFLVVSAAGAFTAFSGGSNKAGISLLCLVLTGIGILVLFVCPSPPEHACSDFPSPGCRHRASADHHRLVYGLGPG